MGIVGWVGQEVGGAWNEASLGGQDQKWGIRWVGPEVGEAGSWLDQKSVIMGWKWAGPEIGHHGVDGAGRWGG